MIRDVITSIEDQRFDTIGLSELDVCAIFGMFFKNYTPIAVSQGFTDSTGRFVATAITNFYV